MRPPGQDGWSHRGRKRRGGPSPEPQEGAGPGPHQPPGPRVPCLWLKPHVWVLGSSAPGRDGWMGGRGSRSAAPGTWAVSVPALRPSLPSEPLSRSPEQVRWSLAVYFRVWAPGRQLPRDPLGVRPSRAGRRGARSLHGAALRRDHAPWGCPAGRRVRPQTAPCMTPLPGGRRVFLTGSLGPQE